eukprot:1616354-Rhodomonas_salina.1
MEAPYGTVILDSHTEKNGNYRVEPAGLFRYPLRPSYEISGTDVACFRLEYGNPPIRSCYEICGTDVASCGYLATRSPVPVERMVSSTDIAYGERC